MDGDFTERGAFAASASCNRARLAWFPAHAGSLAPCADAIAAAAEIREGARDDDMPRGEAIQVAHLIECYLGWPSFEGVVLDADGEPAALHAWNLLPTGAVMDAAADLHGDGDGPLVAETGSGAWCRYRREWTADYNPELAHRFPELSGCYWDGILDLVKIAPRNAAPRMACPGMR